jgi:hypothetical protein
MTTRRKSYALPGYDREPRRRVVLAARGYDESTKHLEWNDACPSQVVWRARGHNHTVILSDRMRHTVHIDDASAIQHDKHLDSAAMSVSSTFLPLRMKGDAHSHQIASSEISEERQLAQRRVRTNRFARYVTAANDSRRNDPLITGHECPLFSTIRSFTILTYYI